MLAPRTRVDDGPHETRTAAARPPEIDPAAAAMLALQGSAGNAAVARMLAGQAADLSPAPQQVQRGLVDDITGAVSGAAGLLWEGISDAGAFLAKWGGNAIATAGDWMWDLVAEAPDRIWRLLEHLDSGIVGAMDWLWRGLQAAAGPAWQALLGTADWLGRGAAGLFGWAWEGLRRGEAWAERVLHGDLDAVREGLAGVIGWAGDGLKGLAEWSWEGLQGAGVFIQQHGPGLAKWLLDGFLSGAAWVGRLLTKLADLVGFGEIADLVFEIVKFNTRALTPGEVSRMHEVFKDTVDYGQIRVDEYSFIAKFGEWYRNSSTGMGVVLFHTINFNRAIDTAASVDDAAWLAHEVTHVWQYEHVGSQYLGEAFHAQEMIPNAYVYAESSSWRSDRNRRWLEAHRAAGGTFADFNREAQGDLVRHYYHRIAEDNDPYDPAAWQPYIDDLRNGVG